MPPASILLTIPCYRESTRLPRFLAPLCEAMESLGGVSVQAVDDGSGAEEAARMERLIEEARKRFPCLLPLLALPENHGKGGAVRASWNQHSGQDWLGFVDADGSCAPGEVCKLIRLAREQPSPSAALFASRLKILGQHVERSWIRHVLGRMYATLVSEMLRIPVYDSQCGLKLVPRAAWERIAPLLQVEGFAFDAELLCALLESGCEVREIPVNWRDTPGSKIHFFRDTFRMAVDVMAINRQRSRFALAAAKSSNSP